MWRIPARRYTTPNVHSPKASLRYRMVEARPPDTHRIPEASRRVGSAVPAGSPADHDTPRISQESHPDPLTPVRYAFCNTGPDTARVARTRGLWHRMRWGPPRACVNGRDLDITQRRRSVIPKLAAEALGTFWLVLGGCGSAVLAAAFPNVGIGLLGVSLAFGLTVVTMAYAIGPSRAAISTRPSRSDCGPAGVSRRSLAAVHRRAGGRRDLARACCTSSRAARRLSACRRLRLERLRRRTRPAAIHCWRRSSARS